MGGGGLARRLAALVVAGLVCGLVLAGAAQAQRSDDLAALNAEVARLYGEGKYAEALAVQRMVAAKVEREEKAEAGRPGRKTAEALGNLAAFAVLARSHKEALAASNRAVALAPGLLWLETNRAHALLLTGRRAEARKLYLTHKRKRLSDQSDKLWEDAIAEDFDALRAAGIQRPEFPEVLAALGIRNAELNKQIEAVRAQVEQLHAAGKYAEAGVAAERHVALTRKRFGEARSEFAAALNWLGLSLQRSGGLAEAEASYKRSLAVLERALGAEHRDVGASLNNLAGLYQDQGRYAEAEPLYKRSLAIREKALGPEHRDVGTVLNNLAELYRAQGRYAEAEPLYKRGLAIREKTLGPEHREIGTLLNNLAGLYQDQGRYAEAEALFKRSLTIREKALGHEHRDVGASLNNLAVLYQGQGRYAEAELFYKRSLAITEKALGLEHRDVGSSLNNLAELYRAHGRYAEAEPLYKRSLAIREKALGAEHRDVGSSLNNLAELYRAQGRNAEAELLYKRSLAIHEKALGPEHPLVGTILNNLAGLYRAQGRYAEAEALYKRSLATTETALGPEHRDVGTALNNLAQLYRAQGRYAEAEPLHQRSLAIREKALGPDHPAVGTALNNLAWLAYDQSDWARAAGYWRRSTGVIQRRAERSLAGTAEGSSKGEAQRSNWQFEGLVKMMHRLATEGRAEREALALEMFESAQWAQASEAAASLAQMAARSAKGSSDLAALVRERQDLVAEWQVRDKLLIAAKSEETVKRKPEAEKVLADRLATIDRRRAEIDQRLAREFPDYAALANPKASSVAEVQAVLRSDEALVLFLDTDAFEPAPEETFVWVVTKGEVRWARSELGTKALTQRVAGLRCGLDEEQWSGTSRVNQCAALLDRTDDLDRGEPLPFDFRIAHELYQGLFAPVADLIKGKHLLIVPSGPLTSLPFHVLVTEAPSPSPGASPTSPDTLSASLPASGARESRPLPTVADYRDAKWLARSHAITMLPSVASLKALREHSAKRQKAPDDYLGIGNPLLTGRAGECGSPTAVRPSECPTIKVAGAAPPAVVDTTTAPGRATIGGSGGRRSGGKGLGHVYAQGTGAAAVLKEVRALCPLPDTAHELECVSKAFARGGLRLEAHASEVELKNLNANGTLARYRIVHFATHGLVAGDMETMAKRQGEPALVLTPPDQPADADDDGLLTASEVAQLKLNADWVVLSACSTAAGGGANAEALSGLARAFFYAGTRALLVSHWPVYSDAAVQLTTRTFAELERDPARGRAEAFRRAMIALIDDPSQASNAHPAVWAPFVVVGEGGTESDFPPAARK